MVDYFDVKTTCSFTGHRVLKKDFDEYKLKEVIKQAVKRGYKTFLIGMAKGFDMKCFETLLSLNNSNLEIIACVPCDNQSEKYSEEDKVKYENLLKKSSKIIKINNKYFNGCMQIRNRFMIDNSSLLIAYMYAERGGTLYTVNYAKKLNREIIYV